MYERRLFRLTPCLVLLAMLCGCNEGTEAETESTMEVEGTLTIDGKPYGPAVLGFTLSSDENAAAISAQVKEDGTFDLLSYKADEKPPEGSYDVTVDEDPEGMSADGVPVVDGLTVQIKAVDGEVLKLKIEATSTGDPMRTGGALP